MISSNGYLIGSDILEEAPAFRFNDIRILEENDERGFVHIRNVIPTSLVTTLRQAYFSMFRHDEVNYWNDYGKRGHPAHEIQSSSDFKNLVSCKRLEQIASKLLKANVTQLERVPFRHFGPASPATRAHADWDYTNAGSIDIITAWVPLTKADLTSSTLLYLEGSMGLERNELRNVLKGATDRPNSQVITNDLARLASITGSKWRYPIANVGDVVFHKPNVIHASLDCEPNKQRLSVDIRFIRRGGAIDPRWNSTWSSDDGY